jgi:hypothetical protein
MCVPLCMSMPVLLQEERDTLVDRLLATTAALHESEARYRQTEASNSQVGGKGLDTAREACQHSQDGCQHSRRHMPVQPWTSAQQVPPVVSCRSLLHCATYECHHHSSPSDGCVCCACLQVQALLEQLQELLRRAEVERDRAKLQLKRHRVGASCSSVLVLRSMHGCM